MLKTLSDEVGKQADNKQPITDDQLNAMSQSLGKVCDTLESIAKFMTDHVQQVPVLSSFPITMDEVNGWKANLN